MNRPPEEWLAEFRRAVELPEPEINLAYAALLIATDEYPDLNIPEWMRYLDGLALRAQREVADAETPTEKLTRLSHFLFHHLGFSGNRDDYYDPRNSYLNDVLERQLGLPITLAVVYIEIAQRLEMPVFGVGLPGHFVCKWQEADAEIFVDPFNGGVIVDLDDLRARVRDTYRADAELDREWLAPVGPRYILVRLLNNLKGVFVEQENYRRALMATEKLLALMPTATEELREAGVLAYQAKQYRRAAEFLQNYALGFPNARDAEPIRALRDAALNEMAKMN